MADNKVNFLRGTSAEYESSIKDNDTFYYTTDDEKLYLGNKEITGGGVTIDDTLSDTSKNPVQNKVINAALNSKANLSDIPTTLPANGGNADTIDGKHASDFVENMLNINRHFSMVYGDHAYITNAIDNNVPNLPIVSNYIHIINRFDSGEVDTVLSVGTDYTDEVYVYRRKDGIWKSINADTLDRLHASDFAYLTNIVGGLRRGWASTDIGTIITYGDRQVNKTTNDLTYFGWSTNSDGWFFPIIVSQTASGTHYEMFGGNFGYDVSPESDRTSFTYKGRTYYACWSNGGSYNNPTVVGGLHLTLTNNDYISACKTLIDACEAIDAETVDGYHIDSLHCSYYTTDNADNCINPGTYICVPDSTANIPFNSWGILDVSTNIDKSFRTQRYVCVFNLSVRYVRAYVNGEYTEWVAETDGGNADTLDGFDSTAFTKLNATVQLTTSINSQYDYGTFSCEASYTPDFPTGYGSYGYLTVRRYGSICYQTIMFDSGVIIHRAIVMGATEWTNWQRLNDGGNAASANTAGTLATTASNICLRNLSSGTAAANTTNCPSGAWYGQYEEV